MINKIVPFLFCAIQLSIFAQSSVTPPECIAPFYHGVASGDPLTDRVIIWTRVTPSDFNQQASVEFLVATDTAMNQQVAQGVVVTDASRDFTVKVDVSGLSPDTYYYYEFRYEGAFSQRGRTKTAPEGPVDSLRFAIVSCANLEAGYFNSYRVINERNDVDAVLMLGDYIYEYETGGYSPNPNVDRDFDPANEILSLDDYRLRYSIYHMDEALRELHQNFPWICVWDDHESANDAYKDGAQNHDAGEGDWQVRKLNSQQAFFEWLPIREKAPGNKEIFRTFKYGDLIDLVMVDTRLHGRDEQQGQTSGNLNDPNRTMLGDDQFQWLKDELVASTAKWKVLGNQVMMAKLTLFGVPINTDAWDGYPVTRQGLYEHILANEIKNFAVITGDIHTSWAFDLKNGSDRVGVEFITPSVTSPGSPINVGTALSIENPHLKYAELTKKGFVILDVTHEKLQADWYYVATIDEISSANQWEKSYYTNADLSQLVNTSTPTVAAQKYEVAQAPECPRSATTGFLDLVYAPCIIALYPNPVMNELTFHYAGNLEGQLSVVLTDEKGRELRREELSTVYPAHQMNVANLPKGTYFLRLIDRDGNGRSTRFIKL
jgi:alkaline phosphatase D